MKHLFGTSLQAITYRLRDLKVMPEALFKELFELFKEKGWRTAPDTKNQMQLRREKSCNGSPACAIVRCRKASYQKRRRRELLGVSVHTLSQQLGNSDKVTT